VLKRGINSGWTWRAAAKRSAPVNGSIDQCKREGKKYLYRKEVNDQVAMQLMC